MHILLTGATGFVGSHILRGLLEDGHSVSVVKRSFSNTKRVEKLLDKCMVFNVDEVSIDQIYKAYPIECVVHCATYYGRDDKDCRKNIDANLLFPLELLSQGVDRNLKYFINTDSFFGNQIVREQDLDNDLYMYGYTLSKTQFRHWGHMFSVKYGIKFINMKLQHVYGENDSADKFIPFIVKSFRDNVPALKLSEGKQCRDFIYISDVVNAYRTVIKALEFGRVSLNYSEYDIGTGVERSLREFVEIISEALESTTEIIWGAVAMKKGELMYSKADNQKLLDLGWKPEIIDKQDIIKTFRNRLKPGGGYLRHISMIAWKGGVGRCA